MPSSQSQLWFADQLHKFVRTKTQDAYQNLAKGIPGHCSKILENDFIEFTFDAIGPYTLPKINIPQAFSKYHREPTQVGDKGVAVPTDYNIGGESGNDGSTANLYPRGNLTPLTFHPISNKNWPTKDPNMFLVTGGPSGHTTQSADGTTSMVIDIANNLLHKSGKDLIGQAVQQLAQIAQKTMTIASMTDVINHVASKITMGAPASTGTFSTTDEPPIPIPSAQTLLNVIGSITASANITAGGGIAAAGGMIGAVGGSVPVAGSVGEVISANVTTGIAMTNAAPMNVTSISLSPGDWDIHGEVWITGATTASAFVAAINITSAALPTAPNVAVARTQYAGTLSGSEILAMKTVRANLTAQTIYYLVAQCNFTAGTVIGSGTIWARRMR